MNVERLEQLAATIEKGYHTFDGMKVNLNMGWFFTRVSDRSEKWPFRQTDGTLPDAVACLIGFTILLFGENKEMLYSVGDRSLNPDEREINALNLDAEARNLLGLSESDSHELFYGSLSDKIPPEEVAKVIRKYLRTGKVVWPMLV